ncbi:RUS family member 1-like [Oppia nitens]|uniref:RUS family member 1-like n=1 Tax=Oppia nitens TaxID=1686743 RepID=UPI0023DA9AD2|nr:RUS family member 1-like [Oppia nitens]
MAKVVARETYAGDDDWERLYVDTDNTTQNRLTVVDKQSRRWISWTALKMLFTSVFLPAGYPDSVSNDYLEYQFWDSVQAFASSIMNNLGTHAVLKGVGVGDSSATVLAATITWLLRDGTSMSGRILFAYIQSSKLDADCKKWRLFADIINDISIMIDLLSPYFVDYFMPMQCFSGVLKSLVGTAGGATRAALTQHQSRRNNLADVSAKDGSQETLVNLTALVCSLIMVPIVANNPHLVWLLFICFTILHIFANYRAVKAVSLETFNLSRFVITVDNWLKTGRILSVREANNRENVWFFWRDLSNGYCDNIATGVSLRDHLCYFEMKIYQTQDNDFQYVLNYDQSMFWRSPTPCVNISLKKGFETTALLKSIFQAIVLLSGYENCHKNNRIFYRLKVMEEMLGAMKLLDYSLDDSNNFMNQLSNYKILQYSHQFTTKWWSEFTDNLVAEGWDLSKVLITPDEWRFEIQSELVVNKKINDYRNLNSIKK